LAIGLQAGFALILVILGVWLNVSYAHERFELVVEFKREHLTRRIMEEILPYDFENQPQYHFSVSNVLQIFDNRVRGDSSSASSLLGLNCPTKLCFLKGIDTLPWRGVVGDGYLDCDTKLIYDCNSLSGISHCPMNVGFIAKLIGVSQTKINYRDEWTVGGEQSFLPSVGRLLGGGSGIFHGFYRSLHIGGLNSCRLNQSFGGLVESEGEERDHYGGEGSDRIMVNVDPNKSKETPDSFGKGCARLLAGLIIGTLILAHHYTKGRMGCLPAQNLQESKITQSNQRPKPLWSLLNIFLSRSEMFAFSRLL
jgi:hypothetical protein